MYYVISLLLFTLGSTAIASAQELPAPPPPPRPWNGETAPRIYVQGALGALGDARERSGTSRVGASVAPSAGAALGAEFPLAHAFSLGVEASYWCWSASRPGDMDVAASSLLEMSAVPRFRNPFSLSTGEHFALALALPIGPSLSFLHNGDGSNALATLGARDGFGSGLHAGAMFELQAFVLPRFGIIFDVGYIHHFLWHPSAIAGERDVQIDFGQAVARLGVVLAL